MNVTIFPGALRGRIEIPSSKSFAHRLLIAAALSDTDTQVMMNAENDDIRATKACLDALSTPAPVLCCRESGSTLRFMLPVTAAMGVTAQFTGEGRLPERPNAPLLEALRAHGVHVSGDFLPFKISGKLRGGEYKIAGNISSQYITGLLLALPLCDEDSEIVLTTGLESAAYVDITLDCLKQFGAVVHKTALGYKIPGGQRYRGPAAVTAEGDWSSAAFWMAANALGHDITCQGLNDSSLQGDAAILSQLKQLGGEIDVSGTPDSVPALAVTAALHPGTTRITNAARLRLKESDRLRAVHDMLTALHGDCEELPDGLVIRGVKTLKGGTVDGFHDHRIVMAAAIAATRASAPVTITGAEAVNKSYPAFFEHLSALGGNVHVKHPGK